MEISDLDAVNIKWHDIAILELAEIDNDKVLILLCRDQPEALKFRTLLKSNEFNIDIAINSGKESTVKIIFIKSRIIMYLDTDRRPQIIPL